MDSLSGSEQLGQAEIFTKKGPVFATAIVAGTQAVKRTSDLIPFCHSIPVESCKFDIVLASLSHDQTEAALGRYSHAVKISCEVKCEAKTGVEMEALVGVSNAALCVYDMLKAASHDMLITDICLQMKSIFNQTLLRSVSRTTKKQVILGGVRNLNVHEYISMDIMRSFGITVPRGGVAHNLDEVQDVYSKVIGEGNDCVIKAMVLTGGRGLGSFSNGFKGGVHLCSKPGDVTNYASKMLGFNLITKQTTKEGLPCSKVMLVERMYMRREMYLSIMLDRASGGPIFIVSPSGGTSIEDVAAATPELIFKQPVDIRVGVTDEQSTYIATSLGFSPGSKGHNECKDLVHKLYKLFCTHDCTLLEVNPLAETPDSRVVVCDAKINFDPNAEFRQKDIFKFRDRSQEDWREVEAAKNDLNYIGLTGNIGCMVNGAGLAMATMDIIKLEGGDPANFLDVGGGASESQVEKAFELLNADKQVKTILVNIFGGIMRCDVIAMGIINAAHKIGMTKPIIIRLKGTNVAEAKKLIEASGYRLIVTDDLEDAAKKAVHVADIVRQAEEVRLSVQFGGGNAGAITPL
eukprot:scaffold1593_cov170-Ochromonas_danica.AAC.6